MIPPDIRQLVTTELDHAPGKDVAAMAAQLKARPGVAAVLFYGNMLREAGAGGLMDFYILTESDAAYHGVGISALANNLLPPNVYFMELDPPSARAGEGQSSVAAKVAVMRLDAFRDRMRPEVWDTTLWARFSQPALLLYARDEGVRGAVIDGIVDAYDAAAWWAAHLSEPGIDAQAAWEALYTSTYGAELRVEGAGRASLIVERALPLYQALHQAKIAPLSISPNERKSAQVSWNRRRRWGKALNISRLTKAAFTFRGGLAYALSKIERHSGAPVELRPWERRVPWLAAPIVLLRLLRERRLR